MSHDKSESVPEGAKEILEYFLRHPRAADSLEGVARWRLLEESIHRNIEETNQALGWLASQGFLLEEDVATSGPIFCLNRAKAAEAERFLTEARAAGARDKD